MAFISVFLKQNCIRLAPIMPLAVVDQRMIFPVGWSSQREEAFFGGSNRTARCYVAYKKYVELRCGCSVPAAESAVGIEQVVAHTAGKSILCREGLRRAALPK